MADKDSYWFIKKSQKVNKLGFGYVYLLRFEKWYKVGITTDLKNRYNAFRFGLPTNDFEMLGFMTYEKNGKLENAILNDLLEYKTRGEWVECDINSFMEVIEHWANEFDIKIHTNNG